MIAFTHLILLSRSPHYIYAQNEDEVLKIIERFKPSEIIGVAVSSASIEVKRVKMAMSLGSIKKVEIEFLPALLTGQVGLDGCFAEKDEEAFKEAMKDVEAPEQRQVHTLPGDPQQVS